MDAMKRIMELLGKKQLDLARQAYVKMRADCLVIEGRKIGDKVSRVPLEFNKRSGTRDGRYTTPSFCVPSMTVVIEVLRC